MDDAARVGRYYDEVIFDAEKTRLDNEFAIEFEITARNIKRYISSGVTVAEVGVGGGQYSQLLASCGCRLHLIDISQRLLETVHAKLPQATAQLASATDLPLENESCDAVLLLGPLYHLTQLQDRQRAVAEAARVLRPSGVLLAAGINRMAYLRDALRLWPLDILKRREFMSEYLREGVLSPEIAPPIGYAHMTTRAEFAALFEVAFTTVRLIPIESFGSAGSANFRSLPPEAQHSWLDVIEESAELPEAMGITDHILFIGRRK